MLATEKRKRDPRLLDESSSSFCIKQFTISKSPGQAADYLSGCMSTDKKREATDKTTVLTKLFKELGRQIHGSE